MKGRHFAFLILATVLTCAFVWVRLQIVSISYDINTLAAKERVLREDCNALTLRINEKKSPRQLEQLAAAKFKMASPRPDQLIQLPKN